MGRRKAAVPQFNLSQQEDIPLSRHVESAATLAEAKVQTPLPLDLFWLFYGEAFHRSPPALSLHLQRALATSGVKAGGSVLHSLSDDGHVDRCGFVKSSKKMAGRKGGGGGGAAASAGGGGAAASTGGGWFKSMASKVISSCHCHLPRLLLLSVHRDPRLALCSPRKTKTLADHLCHQAQIPTSTMHAMQLMS